MGGKNRNIVFSVFLILLLFLYSFPFIKSGFPHGNDIFYHFSRIQGSAELLKSEHFDFSILPGFFFDYGYAVGLFYPLGLLFIPIVLIYVGLNFITAYKILIVFVTFLTFIGMFYTTYKLFKNRWLALISSTFYVFSVYRNYSDLYERAAIGEFIAFTFLPWIFYGVHILVHDRSKRWMILCFGMVGLILTHTISTMLVVLMLIGYVALNIKAILSNPKSILYLFLATMMTILLTAYYWAPMLEMMMADQYYYQIPWTHIDLNTLTNPMSSFYINTQISLFPYGIELYAVVIVLIGFVFKFKTIWTNPFLRFSLTMGILTLMIASNVLPISWFKFLDFMQFPWRFFMFVDYFFAILIGYTLSALFKSKTTVIVSILFIFFVVIQYLSFSNYYIQVRMKDYLYEDFVRYDYNGKEFIPTSVYIPNLITNAAERVVQSSQTIDLSYTRRVEGYVLEFNQKGQINTVLEFPLIYYKGYSAYLSSDYGNRFLEISKTENGMIQVNLGDVQSGNVHVFYNGTRLKKIAEVVSGFTLFSLVVYFFINFIKIRRFKGRSNV